MHYSSTQESVLTFGTYTTVSEPCITRCYTVALLEPFVGVVFTSTRIIIIIYCLLLFLSSYTLRMYENIYEYCVF
jgi:hypothetical protein